MFEQGRYAHLLPQDAPILSAYLKEHGADYQSVDFDVRVGTGRDPGPDYDANIRKMALDLSRRRIDALGRTKRGADIIEVTDAAGVTALGQLLAYGSLYMIDHPDEPQPRLIIAARTLQSDMFQAYRAAGIVIHLYPSA